MGDLRIFWDPATGTGDLAMDGPALATGNDLETAVLVSLFTEAVADPSDLLPPGQADDPRGWWADSLTGDPIGSKLWQAFWRTTSPDTLNWARDEVRKSLQWLLDDGVATAIEADAQFIGKGGLAIRVVVTEPNGRRTPFSYAWDQER